MLRWIWTSLRILLLLIVSISGLLEIEASATTGGVTGDVNLISLPALDVDKPLNMRLDGRSLIVSPGEGLIDEKLVAVAGKTITIPPVKPVTIQGEEQQWPSLGNQSYLSRCLLAGMGGVQGIVVPGSLKLWSKAENHPNRVYKPGVDYTIDYQSGLITFLPQGAIKKTQKLLADYQIIGRRVDTLAATRSGNLELIQGQPAGLAPVPAAIDPTLLPLANIIVEPGQQTLQPSNIFPISSTYRIPVPIRIKEQNSKALSSTLMKLRSGQRLNIVFWGDSVTCGYFASSKELSFPALVVEKLRVSFPKARVSSFVAGVQRSDSASRLPRFSQEVLSKHPDLIIVEFVNDFTQAEEVLRANYESTIEQAKSKGAEVILCTPHWPSSRYLKTKGGRNVHAYRCPEALRCQAAEQGVALADVSRRFEYLSREGLCLEMTLADNMIHPNDLGHEIYAQEILSCFR